MLNISSVEIAYHASFVANNKDIDGILHRLHERVLFHIFEATFMFQTPKIFTTKYLLVHELIHKITWGQSIYALTEISF